MAGFGATLGGLSEERLLLACHRPPLFSGCHAPTCSNIMSSGHPDLMYVESVIDYGGEIITYNYPDVKDTYIKKIKIKSDLNLMPHERETHIYFSDDDDIAEIDTSQKVIIKRLLNHDFFTPDEKGIIMKDNAIVGVKGSIPRNCITITMKPRKRFDKI